MQFLKSTAALLAALISYSPTIDAPKIKAPTHEEMLHLIAEIKQKGEVNLLNTTMVAARDTMFICNGYQSESPIFSYITQAGGILETRILDSSLVPRSKRGADKITLYSLVMQELYPEIDGIPEKIFLHIVEFPIPRKMPLEKFTETIKQGTRRIPLARYHDDHEIRAAVIREYHEAIAKRKLSKTTDSRDFYPGKWQKDAPLQE